MIVFVYCRKSLYTYAVIVPAVNTFSVMTGAWLLLAFDNFTYHEAELAQVRSLGQS